MKIYKYVEILEPDCYYGGPDEEILFYCTDKNKDVKIKKHLMSVIDKHRSQKYRQFLENKKYYNARIFYDFQKNILGLISDTNEYFILENALILNKPEYFLSSCSHGHHQFHLANKENEKRNIYLDLKVSKEKFYSYNLKECEYLINENYVTAKTPLNCKINFGNYDLFEKNYLKILNFSKYNSEIKKNPKRI